MGDQQAPTPGIELIWDDQCPNVDKARRRLAEALTRLELPQEWQEWQIGDPASPPHTTHYGSPTILIDGKDVAGESGRAGGGSSCRVYGQDGGGFDGAPSVEAIEAAIEGEVG